MSQSTITGTLMPGLDVYVIFSESGRMATTDAELPNMLRTAELSCEARIVSTVSPVLIKSSKLSFIVGLFPNSYFISDDPLSFTATLSVVLYPESSVTSSGNPSSCTGML